MEVSYFGSSIIKSHLQLLAASGELSAYPKIKVKLVSYFAEARWVINSGHYFDARAKKKKFSSSLSVHPFQTRNIYLLINDSSEINQIYAQ